MFYKKQMDAIKAEKENEKKASAPNKEELMKKLEMLTAGISVDTSVDVGTGPYMRIEPSYGV